jgi:hypothetical protein
MDGSTMSGSCTCMSLGSAMTASSSESASERGIGSAAGGGESPKFSGYVSLTGVDVSYLTGFYTYAFY